MQHDKKVPLSPFDDEAIYSASAEQLIDGLRKLLEARGTEHKRHRAERKREAKIRQTLRGKAREQLLASTNGRCHICGGRVGGKWQADHVLAHSAGGECLRENFLPAHGLCNHYRWDYLPEEFLWILKMGVWCRTLMQKSSSKESLGRMLAEKFLDHEKKRIERQKNGTRITQA